MSATPTPWLQGTGGGGGAPTYVYENAGTGQQCRAIAACYLPGVTRDYHEREANAALIVKAVNAAALLDRAIEFSAYSAVDPLTIRLDFASADDRIAAADALDELFSALARGETA